LTMLDCLRRRANFAILSLYDQAIALELSGARRPYEKPNVGTALDELRPEISPERAGTQHKKSHFVPHGIPLRRGC
jgi:hypothetical protein